MISKLAILLLVHMGGSAQGSCFQENSTWLSPDILAVRRSVDEPSLCQEMCAGLEGCTAFTLTTDGYAELMTTCFLFAEIYNPTSCEGCVSGAATCTCSSEVACYEEEGTVLEVFPGVQTEGECKHLCQDPFCTFCTWHGATSFPVYTCILHASCEDTYPCSGCFTGPSKCSTTPAEEGEKYK